MKTKHKNDEAQLNQLAVLLDEYINLSDTERLIFDAAYVKHIKLLLKQKD